MYISINNHHITVLLYILRLQDGRATDKKDNELIMLLFLIDTASNLENL